MIVPSKVNCIDYVSLLSINLAWDNRYYYNYEHIPHKLFLRMEEIRSCTTRRLKGAYTQYINK